MRVLLIFIICGFVALPSTLYPATTIQQTTSATLKLPEILYEKLAPLKIKEVQKIIGRKLTFKEKDLFAGFKTHLKRKPKLRKGILLLIFGIVGLALLLIGLFVPFRNTGSDCRGHRCCRSGIKCKKTGPIRHGKARAAALLGWITLGAIALLLIIAAIVVASEGWLLIIFRLYTLLNSVSL